MQNPYFGHMFGWGLGGSLVMIIFWSAVILLVVWLLKQAAGTAGNESSKTPSALETLKERYAKGEIGKEEFEQKKTDLQAK